MAVFTESDICELERQIKAAEGFRLIACRCLSGSPTSGCGPDRAISPVDGVARIGERTPREEEERLFALALSDAVWRVRRALPWVTELSPPRQAVLYAMAYSMGLGAPGASGLLAFREILTFVRSGNYPAAARGMLASRWARQTRDRAGKLARQMDTGEWQ